MQTISPFLWFEDQAEEATAFYVSIFPNSAIQHVTRYGSGMPGPAGSVMSVSFVLDGLQMQALNGGRGAPFTEAVSFLVPADGQAEVDRLWDALTDGGQPSRCGWLKDRYGLSWQIVPPQLLQLLSDPDPGRASRATQAMLGMGKIDIAALHAAADGLLPSDPG